MRKVLGGLAVGLAICMIASTSSAADEFLPIYIGNSYWKSAFPTAVNEAGQIVGYGYTVNDEWHAFFWEDGLGMVDLGTFGGSESKALGINEDGLVAGWASTYGGSARAFVWAKEFSGKIGLGDFYETQAIAVNDEGVLAGSWTASLNPPSIFASVRSSPSTIPEGSSSVTYSIAVSNERLAGHIVIMSLVDSVYGSLDGAGTCVVPQTIEPLDVYECSYSVVVSGQAGETLTNTFVASGYDESSDEVTDSDDAQVYVVSNDDLVVSVAVSGVFPITEPGAERTFSVSVHNRAVPNPDDPDEGKFEVTSLVDSVYGNLDGKGTCSVSRTIWAGTSYSCSFPGLISGFGGDRPTNTVTAEGMAATGETIRDSASWSTTIAASGPIHAAIWERESDVYEMLDLGALWDPSFQSVASAMSNSGHVVGFSRDADGYAHAFIWEPESGMQEIVPAYRSEAVAVNDAGMAIGNLYPTGGREPFFWDGPNLEYLGTLGGSYASALALNSAGTVAGTSQAPEGPYIIRYHAFVWKAGTMTDLWNLCPEGLYCQYARDINDSGFVVGGGDSREGFGWKDDVGFMRLWTLGGAHSSASRVTEDGLVVGTSGRADDYWAAPHHPTVWKHVDRFTTGELFESLTERLSEYIDAGVLSYDKPLMAKLEDGTHLFEKGNLKGALHKLEDFRDRLVRTVEEGEIGDNQAQPLYIAIDAILERLQE